MFRQNRKLSGFIRNAELLRLLRRKIFLRRKEMDLYFCRNIFCQRRFAYYCRKIATLIDKLTRWWISVAPGMTCCIFFPGILGFDDDDDDRSLFEYLTALKGSIFMTNLKMAKFFVINVCENIFSTILLTFACKLCWYGGVCFCITHAGTFIIIISVLACQAFLKVQVFVLYSATSNFCFS